MPPSDPYDLLLASDRRTLSHADRTPQGRVWMMDPVTLIEGALAAGAALGVKDTASSAVQDAYQGLKSMVKRRFAGRPTAELALAEHEAAPETAKAALTSELSAIGVDDELVVAAQTVLRLIDPAGSRAGKYEIDARGSQGVQVGDHNTQNLYVTQQRGAAETSDPIHPMGVRIHARKLQNEPTGTIRADGPGSFIDLVADDLVNAGAVIADQGRSGTRLADHLRYIAALMFDDAAKWDEEPAQSGYSTFAEQYIQYGFGRQAGELYDSAMQARLATSMTRLAA